MGKIQDAGAHAVGERSEQQLKTARNHFNTFLQQHGEGSIGAKVMEQLQPVDVTSELIGCFATYLFMTLKKLSGALSYLSQIKGYFTKKWQGCPEWSLHPNNTGEGWYTDVRAGVTKMYTNRAISEGEALVDQAPPMYRNSLRQISGFLFARNTQTAMEERDLIITQWHCMGRANEAGIRHSSVKYVGAPTGALQFAVGRTKTNSLQYIHAFCDSETWESDIFHAKACHLMTSTNVDDNFHFRVASASVINKILARVCAGSPEEQKYQSHSGRRGCASEALSHNGVSVAEVINRGGWAFDAVSRVFMYFSGVDRGDMRVGRVVSGWPRVDSGGIPASSNCLPQEERQIFAAFANDLFKRYLHIHAHGLFDALASSAVMYYNDVRTTYPESICVRALEQALDRVHGSADLLSGWSSALKHNWFTNNLPSIRIDQIAKAPDELKTKIQVPYHSFAEVLSTQAAATHQTALEVAELRKTLDEQAAQLRLLSIKADACESMQKAIMVSLNHILEILQRPSSTPFNPQMRPMLHPIPTSVNDMLKTKKHVPIPSSLARMRASCLCMDYFANRWGDIVPQQNEREVLRKIKQLVQRFIDFMPASYNIKPPPSPGHHSYITWYTDLQQQTVAAEARISEYIDQIKPGQRKRDRSQLTATSVNKDLANATGRPDYPKRRAVSAVVERQ